MPVEALDKGEEPKASGDEPGDGYVQVMPGCSSSDLP
jgi:hypothetical protein